MVASHEAYPAVPEFQSSRVVLILRSIPDVMVSGYHHARHTLSDFSGTQEEFLRDPRRGLLRYCRYLRSWSEAPVDQQLLVTYEKLHTDTVGELGRVLAFLGLEVEPNLVADSVRAATFEQMQRLEISRGMAGHVHDRSNPAALKIRVGRTGSAAHSPSAQDSEYIRQIVADELRSRGGRCAEWAALLLPSPR